MRRMAISANARLKRKKFVEVLMLFVLKYFFGVFSRQFLYGCSSSIKVLAHSTVGFLKCKKQPVSPLHLVGIICAFLDTQPGNNEADHRVSKSPRDSHHLEETFPRLVIICWLFWNHLLRFFALAIYMPYMRYKFDFGTGSYQVTDCQTPQWQWCYL